MSEDTRCAGRTTTRDQRRVRCMLDYIHTELSGHKHGIDSWPGRGIKEKTDG